MSREEYQTYYEDLFDFDDDHSRSFDDIDDISVSRTLFAQGVRNAYSATSDVLVYVATTMLKVISTIARDLGDLLDRLLGLIPQISTGSFKAVTYPLTAFSITADLNAFFDECSVWLGPSGWFTRCTLKECLDKLLQLVLLIVVLVLLSLVVLSISSKIIRIVYVVLTRIKRLLWYSFSKTVLGPIISLLDCYLLEEEIKKRDRWENFKAGRPLDDETLKRARLEVEKKRKEEQQNRIIEERLRGNQRPRAP